MQLRQAIEQLVRPIVESRGYEYVGLDIEQSGRSLLFRLYIDRLDRDEVALHDRDDAAFRDADLHTAEHHDAGSRSSHTRRSDHGGVSLADCANISYATRQAIDVEFADLASRYSLEVSSPGLDRKLFTLEQCRQQIGRIVKVTLPVPINGTRNFKGKLIAVEDGGQLLLEVDDKDGKDNKTGKQLLKFNFADIKRVKVVPQWD